MRLSPRLLLALALAGGAAVAAPARLGETLPELRKRFGAPQPQAEPSKMNAFWLFEGDDGELMYSVTFNAKGRSIAEGLKPLKRARFNRTLAMDFIESQLAPVRDSKTQHVMQPGESYHFAGRTMTCGPQEYIVVDEPLGLLIVWSQAGVPSVLVLSPEMIARM